MGFKEAAYLNFGIFGACLLMDVFNTYYLKVFTQIYHLPIRYLNIVQGLFLAWNAINDPLMGYMQDIGCCGMKWIMNRRKVILYSGPVFAASYMLFWIPWGTSSYILTTLQLLVSLFIYDTLLTLVLSAYCGLVVEQSSKHSDRVRIIVLGELFGLLAGFSILPIESLSHSLEDFRTFQWVTVAVATVAGLAFIITGKLLTDEENTQEQKMESESITGKEKADNSWMAALKVSWQVICEFRFICLVGAQMFRILRFMANEQFLILFVENLLVATGFWKQGDRFLGFYYVLSRSVASGLFLGLWLPVNKLGAQSIIQLLNTIALLNCILMWCAGRESHLWIAVYIVIENTIARCGWQGYYMIIAGEVIDTDTKNYQRKTPISTVIFTLKAFFNKPADQLAPIIITTIFDKAGLTLYSVSCINMGGSYQSIQNATNIEDIVDTTENYQVTASECSSLQQTIFLTLVFFPFFCALGEMFFVATDQFYRRMLKKKEILETRCIESTAL